MGKTMKSLVSIVTPVYNGSKYIEELILSVLDQDYPCIEHIVIDDGSNDNGATVEILKRYPHLRWWSRPNKGAYATINEGLVASKGELLTVICADDMYASRTALSSAVNLWVSNPNYDAVFGETLLVDINGRELDNEPPMSGPIWMFRYCPIVSHCSLLVRRSVVIDGGMFFDLSFPYEADHDWIIRLIRAGCHFRRLRKPIAKFRLHPMQRGQTMNAARCEERRRITQQYGEVNQVILYVIKMWRQGNKLKHLLRCRGFLGCLGAINERFSHGETMQ